MKWIYIPILWTCVCTIMTLLFLCRNVYNMAAFWALLAIISAIYSSVIYAVNMYLKQKHFDFMQKMKFDFDKELKKIQEEMKIDD